MEILRTKTGYQLGNMEATGLAPRECQVLLLKALGYKNTAAAEYLGCGERTIRGRIENLLYKLKAHNSAQMVANAFKAGNLKIALVIMLAITSTFTNDHNQRLNRARPTRTETA
jgi:DNA-binding NarL/FixJ family response regulator